MPTTTRPATKLNDRAQSQLEQPGFSLLSVQTFDALRRVVGFPYVVLSLYLSVRFLLASQTMLSNDLFWTEFNATSGGIYVANVFNTMLLDRQHQSVKITSPEFAVLGSMATIKPQIIFPSSYARTLLFHHLNTPRHAIVALRRKESMRNMFFQQTQFCWVDLDRNFSVAHTAKRAKRCLANETTNGAVYLETYLRNFDSTSFLQSWEAEFTYGIVDPLSESAEGRAFLTTIHEIWQSPGKQSVDQEVAHWQSKGITHFTMQWGNLRVPGVTEQISLVSALGSSVKFTIKTLLPVTPGRRTTMKLYWSPINDFWAVGDNTTAISGMSLVRGTSKFYENFGISMEQVIINDGTLPWPLTPKDQLLRDALGPFGSIDIKQIMYPDSLFDLVINTSRIVNERILNNPEAQQLYSKIAENKKFSVYPIAWRPPVGNSSILAWGSYGGNPLCSVTAVVQYVTQFIEYSDACQGIRQEKVTLTRVMQVISLIAMKNPPESSFMNICSNGSLEITTCIDSVNATSRFINDYIPVEDRQRIQALADTARQDLLQVNPELAQFVVNNSNTSHFKLLLQPMMSTDPDDPWNVFGWWYAVDWAIGHREVLHLEGDDGTLLLLSGPVAFATLAVGKSAVPTSMSLSFLRVVQYTTLVTITCALLAILYAFTNKGHVAGSNLLEFNRVIGAVWIGRPLLIARGVVAVCMISTSLVILKVHGSMTKFDETKKSWYNVIIAAGESCWFSYVTTDIFVTFTKGYTYRYAMVAAILAQVVNAVVELIKPFEHSAEIDMQCEMTLFYEDVLCHSGTVQIGNLTRFIKITAIAVAITVVTFAVMRCWLLPAPSIAGGNMLLSGIAKEVYNYEGWTHQGRWYLDKASAVLTGLVTLPFRGCSLVLDVKTWTLLYLHSNRLTDEKPKMSTMRVAKGVVPQGASMNELPTWMRHAMALTLAFGSGPGSLGKAHEATHGYPRKTLVKEVTPATASNPGFKSAKVVSSSPPVLAISSKQYEFSASSDMLELLRRCLGFIYVVWTVFLSVQFLFLSQSTLKTDLFWDDFNQSTAGIVVSNIFNTMLLNRQHERITLTSPEFAAFGTMSAKPQIDFSSAYARTLLYHRLNTPRHAIDSLRRKGSTEYCLYQQTQFCWLDFNRNFSLAHTAKRAIRCLANETTNGAVYLEPFLRNFDSTTFLDSFRDMYVNGIQEPLQESAEGREFLQNITDIWKNGNALSVDQEAAYWKAKGITHFTMQWGNYMGPGVTEQINFVNALGISQNLTIKRLAPINPGQRTTMKIYWIPIDDLWAVGINTTLISGMSLIRGTSKFYENFNFSMEQIVINDGNLPWPLSPKDQILRQVLGPFGSIDMKQLMYADSLFDLVMNTTRVIHQQLLGDSKAQVLYSNITDNLGISVFPLAWRPLQSNSNDLVWSYLGGNPLCSTGAAVPYVQQFFEYSDECVGSLMEGLHLTRVTLVASLLAIGNPPQTEFQTICESGTISTDNCVENLNTTSQFINTYLSEQDRKLIKTLAATAREDLLQVNPELIQFVVSNMNSSHFDLLHQPVMTEDPTDPWNVFGWWYAMGWATGRREVVRFEGDDGTLTLISAQLPTSTLSVMTSEVPSSMSSTFLRVVEYSSLIAAMCALLAFTYSIANKGRVAGANLLQFNRVTGSVWIGRPLMIARGIVAVIMISTSHVILRDHGLMNKFDEVKKPWYSVVIAAGETCWLSYVTTDMLVTFTKGYTYYCAVAGALLAQLIVALIAFVDPYQHKAEIDLHCDIVLFYQDVLCHSGTVEIGNLSRLLVVAAVPMGVTLLTILVMKLLVTPTPRVPGASMLLAGIAHEVYSVDGWIHDSRWYLDKASAVLTGLVTIPFGGHARVLDVKTWTLLYLHKNCLNDNEPQRNLNSVRPSTAMAKSAKGADLPARLRGAMALTVQFDDDLRTKTTSMVPDAKPKKSFSVRIGSERHHFR